MEDKSINMWNAVAESYHAVETASDYGAFCRRFIADYLRDISGLRALDACCGDGSYSKILTENGAEVYGCDGSSEMVRIAEKNCPNAQFKVANMLEKLPYETAEFDLVLCNLALMDFDPIDNALSEFHRILKPGGRFVFSILHPAFFISDWIETESSKMAKAVDRYITPLCKTHNFYGETLHFHRPLNYYFNTAAKYGFKLTQMCEPSCYEQRKNPDIPLYLFADFLA